eukprot:PhF_6_TR10089/c0_g1_i1/m.15707
MSSKKGSSSEIDDIFNQLRPAQSKGKRDPTRGPQDENKKKKKKKTPTEHQQPKGHLFEDKPKELAVPDEEFFDVKGTKSSGGARKVVEGFPVYTEQELTGMLSKKKMKKAGTTALCPFDCDCCF